MKNNIIVPKVTWGFNNDGPSIIVGKEADGYERAIKVDPAPCYMHPAILVLDTLEHCQSCFPTNKPTTIYLSPHECLGRTNGWTDSNVNYSNKEDMGSWSRPIPNPYILLMGKRIPPMPAMTRYLVAHEYGHVIDHLMSFKRYKVDPHDAQKHQQTEYEKLRGITKQDYYGPGTWHLDPGEIFANDFRIAVCNIEPEFWPHEVPHPYDSPQVIQWWEERVKEGL